MWSLAFRYTVSLEPRLGDVLLPGLLLSFMARYDTLTQHDITAEGNCFGAIGRFLQRYVHLRLHGLPSLRSLVACCSLDRFCHAFCPRQLAAHVVLLVLLHGAGSVVSIAL